MGPKTLSLSDDEIILTQRLWFLNNPDPRHRAEVLMILDSPYLQSQLRTTINHARVRLGKPLITNHQFQRLLYLMKEGTNV